MHTFIACFIAGICMAGFVAIGLTTAYKELSAKRNSLIDLEVQLHLHERLSALEKDGPNARSATKMLETSRMLCHEAAKGYNRILHKPMNRFRRCCRAFGRWREMSAGRHGINKRNLHEH